jgi:small GTP-binding protein
MSITGNSKFFQTIFGDNRDEYKDISKLIGGFDILIYGEVSVGKSSFVNFICGNDMCETGITHTTTTTTTIKWIDDDGLLINICDSAANNIDKQKLQVPDIENVLLVVYVMSITSFESDDNMANFKYIYEEHRKLGRSVICVINKCDEILEQQCKSKSFLIGGSSEFTPDAYCAQVSEIKDKFLERCRIHNIDTQYIIDNVILTSFFGLNAFTNHSTIEEPITDMVEEFMKKCISFRHFAVYEENANTYNSQILKMLQYNEFMQQIGKCINANIPKMKLCIYKKYYKGKYPEHMKQQLQRTCNNKVDEGKFIMSYMLRMYDHIMEICKFDLVREIGWRDRFWWWFGSYKDDNNYGATPEKLERLRKKIHAYQTELDDRDKEYYATYGTCDNERYLFVRGLAYYINCKFGEWCDAMEKYLGIGYVTWSRDIIAQLARLFDEVIIKYNIQTDTFDTLNQNQEHLIRDMDNIFGKHDRHVTEYVNSHDWVKLKLSESPNPPEILKSYTKLTIFNKVIFNVLKQIMLQFNCHNFIFPNWVASTTSVTIKCEKGSQKEVDANVKKYKQSLVSIDTCRDAIFEKYLKHCTREGTISSHDHVIIDNVRIGGIFKLSMDKDNKITFILDPSTIV